MSFTKCLPFSQPSVKDVFEHGKPADRQAKIEELVALFAKGIGLSK